MLEAEFGLCAFHASNVNVMSYLSNAYFRLSELKTKLSIKVQIDNKSRQTLVLHLMFGIFGAMDAWKEKGFDKDPLRPTVGLLTWLI